MERSNFLRLPVESAPIDASGLDELAARAARGDRGAFELIYDQTAQVLFSYVLAMTKKADVTEDLVATVYLNAWRSARSYKRGSNAYRSWLFAIARNELKDHWRRTGELLLNIDDVEVEAPNTLDTEADRAETRELAGRALSLLTPDQRDVVVLRYYADMTHEEIAAVLQKRVGSVRALLMRGLRQMRKVMTDDSP